MSEDQGVNHSGDNPDGGDGRQSPDSADSGRNQRVSDHVPRSRLNEVLAENKRVYAELEEARRLAQSAHELAMAAQRGRQAAPVDLEPLRQQFETDPFNFTVGALNRIVTDFSGKVDQTARALEAKRQDEAQQDRLDMTLEKSESQIPGISEHRDEILTKIRAHGLSPRDAIALVATNRGLYRDGRPSLPGVGPSSRATRTGKVPEAKKEPTPAERLAALGQEMRRITAKPPHMRTPDETARLSVIAKERAVLVATGRLPAAS